MENEKKPAITTTTEKRTEHRVKNDDVPFIKGPYLDYDNLEGNNKLRAYGTEVDQKVKAGLAGGATDASTPLGGVGRGGGAASSDLSSTGAISRQGVS